MAPADAVRSQQDERLSLERRVANCWARITNCDYCFTALACQQPRPIDTHVVLLQLLRTWPNRAGRTQRCVWPNIYHVIASSSVRKLSNLLWSAFERKNERKIDWLFRLAVLLLFAFQSKSVKYSKQEKAFGNKRSRDKKSLNKLLCWKHWKYSKEAPLLAIFATVSSARGFFVATRRPEVRLSFFVSSVRHRQH